MVTSLRYVRANELLLIVKIENENWSLKVQWKQKLKVCPSWIAWTEQWTVKLLFSNLHTLLVKAHDVAANKKIRDVGTWDDHGRTAIFNNCSSALPLSQRKWQGASMTLCLSCTELQKRGSEREREEPNLGQLLSLEQRRKRWPALLPSMATTQACDGDDARQTGQVVAAAGCDTSEERRRWRHRRPSQRPTILLSRWRQRRDRERTRRWRRRRDWERAREEEDVKGRKWRLGFQILSPRSY